MDLDEIRKKTTLFDPAKYLDTPESQAELLADAFETKDEAYMLDAIGIVARARGMTQIAKESGLTREALYKSFSKNGDPKLSSVLAVFKALGVELQAKPAPSPASNVVSRRVALKGGAEADVFSKLGKKTIKFRAGQKTFAKT